MIKIYLFFPTNSLHILVLMPPKHKAIYSSGNSATSNSTNCSKKVACVATSVNAPTSLMSSDADDPAVHQNKGGPSTLPPVKSTSPENVDSEPPQQAVCANCDQGRHAFQLTNAIKSHPSRKKAAADLSIPVFLPDNAMVPPQKGNNKVN